jgi:predicted methyltransferase
MKGTFVHGRTAMKFADRQNHERRVLKAIYHLTLEDLDRATFLGEVQAATGLPFKEVQDVCKALQKSGYIERTNLRIAITDEGIAYSEKLIEQNR